MGQQVIRHVLFGHLLVFLLALTVSCCSAREIRCDAICSIEDLREQCERCKIRYPMRFGKRSSPPENFVQELEDELQKQDPDVIRGLGDPDKLDFWLKLLLSNNEKADFKKLDFSAEHLVEKYNRRKEILAKLHRKKRSAFPTTTVHSSKDKRRWHQLKQGSTFRFSKTNC